MYRIPGISSLLQSRGDKLSSEDVVNIGTALTWKRQSSSFNRAVCSFILPFEYIDEPNMEQDTNVDNIDIESQQEIIYHQKRNWKDYRNDDEIIQNPNGKEQATQEFTEMKKTTVAEEKSSIANGFTEIFSMLFKDIKSTQQMYKEKMHSIVSVKPKYRETKVYYNRKSNAKFTTHQIRTNQTLLQKQQNRTAALNISLV